jgi:hypothetical protein
METREPSLSSYVSVPTQNRIFFHQFVFCLPALLKLSLLFAFFRSRFLKTSTLKIKNKQEYYLHVLVWDSKIYPCYNIFFIKFLSA